jgi:hypothetical protein
VGVIVSGDLGRAAGELLSLLEDPGLSARCRAVAEEHFALRTALDRYEAIWRVTAGDGR